MNRSNLRALMALLLAFAGAIVATPVGAMQPLLAKACVLASEHPLTLDQARAARGWNCRPAPADVAHDHVWLRIDGDRVTQGQDLLLRSDSLAFAGLTTVTEHADGTVRTRRYADADLGRHWTVGTRFAVPLLSARERADTIWLGVDRPLDRNVAVLAHVIPVEDDAAQRLKGLVLFALFGGMMLVVAIYSLALSVALRSSFALWHGAMVALFLIYTVSASSLLFMLLPGLGLWERSATSYLSLALSMAMIAPFFRAFLENGILPRWAMWVMGSASVLVAVAGFGFVALAHHFPFVARPLYHAAYIPVLGAFIMVCAIAWRRGSEAMSLVALAWSLPALVAIDRILRGMNMYLLPHEWDFVFYAAMAWQSVVMAIGITLRISRLRLERDLALAKERSLGQIAQTDGLTGLPNRRAFDEREWRSGDYLAIIDADRFKQVNDRYGHQVGDRVLEAIALEMQRSVDAHAECLATFRLGGEEFAALVAARSNEEAALVINALRQRISATVSSRVPELAGPLTVSAGVARIGRGGIDKAYQSADRALYKAKNAGRDRLCYEMDAQGMALIFPRRKQAA
ncbi:GGDEF domain-containing protein [Leptolyngbya sp. 15MV]|nr:GGDEF domain-containing protein [Leptolyngbya sp. 15MV]